jgi:hypothetical protein
MTGPFLVNIKFPITKGVSGGGALYYEVEYYDTTDIPSFATFQAASVMNPDYTYGDNWSQLYIPSDTSGGDWQANVPGVPTYQDEPTWGWFNTLSEWFYDNAMYQFSGHDWRGPDNCNSYGQDTYWTNYPAKPTGYFTGTTDANWGPNGAAFPLGFDTGVRYLPTSVGGTNPLLIPYGPLGGNGTGTYLQTSTPARIGADLIPDMTYPVIGVFFQTFDVVTSGLGSPWDAHWPTITPAMPQPGAFTIYNDTPATGLVVPLEWTTTDTHVFGASTTAFPTTGSTPIPVTLNCWSQAMYAYLDLTNLSGGGGGPVSQVQAQAVASGLIAVD